MDFQVVTGHEFEQHIHAVAALRIGVFREYPYLYDGDMQTEMDYLRSYAASKNSILIIVKDEGKIVGVVTGMPLAETDEMFLTPFAKNHLPIHSIFYLGKILLLKEYRSKRIGYQMYQMFEDLVRQKEHYQKIAIAEVIRDKDDPRKPENYIPVHELWKRLGYVVHPEMVIHAFYKEIDSAGKVPHSLVYSFKDFLPQR